MEENGDRAGLKFPCSHTALFLEQARFCLHWTRHLALVEALGSTAKLVLSLCYPQTPSRRHGLGSTNLSRIWEKQISLSLEFKLTSLILICQCYQLMKCCVTVLPMDIFMAQAVSISETQRALQIQGETVTRGIPLCVRKKGRTAF